jgi:putative endonuclease
MRQFFVYILTTSANKVLYTGVTNDLMRRLWQHKHTPATFTSRYQVTKLVYFEVYQDSYEAIRREKQIKAGSRQRKVALIEKENPTWCDLGKDLEIVQ